MGQFFKVFGRVVQKGAENTRNNLRVAWQITTNLPSGASECFILGRALVKIVTIFLRKLPKSFYNVHLWVLNPLGNGVDWGEHKVSFLEYTAHFLELLLFLCRQRFDRGWQGEFSFENTSKERFHLCSFNLLVAVAGPLVVENIQHGTDLVLNIAIRVWLKAHKAISISEVYYSFVLINKILK